MKASVYDKIKLLMDVQSEFSDQAFPRGTIGTIVECYEKPKEGYAVDVALPDGNLVGVFDYDNVILYPDQFEIIAPV